MVAPAARPWHLPLISALAILFYGILAAVYVLAKLQIPAFTQMFSQSQFMVFTALPPVVDGLWAVGVWGGLLGAILLWMESRRTALVLGLALLCLVVLFIYLLTVANALAVTSPTGNWMMAAVAVIALAVYVYARQMHAAGYIR